MEPSRLKAILYVVAAATLWSSAGLFIKWIHLDPISILFYRSLFAAITFAFIFRRSILKTNKTMWISVAFYTPLLIAFVISTKLTTAANAIFLQYTAPSIVLLLEPIVFGTKWTKINVYTILFCMVGMALFFVDKFSTSGSGIGIFLASLSGLLLAGLILSQKTNDKFYQNNTIFWGNIMVCLATSPWIISKPFPVGIDLGLLVILGVGQLALGFYLFIKGQVNLSAFESSIISMLEPLLNPIWVIIGYGELPSIWAWIGGSIIITTLTIRMIIVEKYRRNISS
jgi:drug/metabolite transporter (DMT)-like permease